MFDASDTDLGPEGVDPVDPTLAALVPRSSLRRNVLLSTVGLLVLAAAWASPAVLRPSVDVGGWGSWSSLGGHRQVLVVVPVRVDVWPAATVAGIDHVDGAHVAGAWLFPGEFDPMAAALAPEDFESGVAYVAAELPGFDLAAAALPQRADGDSPYVLVVLWDITDCGRLRADDQSRMPLRSVLGTTTHASLGDFTAPGFDAQTLTDSGACPAA